MLVQRSIGPSPKLVAISVTNVDECSTEVATSKPLGGVEFGKRLGHTIIRDGDIRLQRMNKMEKVPDMGGDPLGLSQSNNSAMALWGLTHLSWSKGAAAVLPVTAETSSPPAEAAATMETGRPALGMMRTRSRLVR